MDHNGLERNLHAGAKCMSKCKNPWTESGMERAVGSGHCWNQTGMERVRVLRRCPSVDQRGLSATGLADRRPLAAEGNGEEHFHRIHALLQASVPFQHILSLVTQVAKHGKLFLVPETSIFGPRAPFQGWGCCSKDRSRKKLQIPNIVAPGSSSLSKADYFHLR